MAPKDILLLTIFILMALTFGALNEWPTLPTAMRDLARQIFGDRMMKLVESPLTLFGCGAVITAMWSLLDSERGSPLHWFGVSMLCVAWMFFALGIQRTGYFSAGSWRRIKKAGSLVAIAVILFATFWWLPSKRTEKSKPGDSGPSAPSNSITTTHHVESTLSMTEWGAELGNKVYAVVKIESPPPIGAPFRVMLVARVQDSSRDEMEDVTIEKSLIRPMASQTIELGVTQDFLERADQWKFVRAILVILPAAVQSNQISTLSDVLKLGGQIAINNSFVMRSVQKRTKKPLTAHPPDGAVHGNSTMTIEKISFGKDDTTYTFYINVQMKNYGSLSTSAVIDTTFSANGENIPITPSAPVTSWGFAPQEINTLRIKVWFTKPSAYFGCSHNTIPCDLGITAKYKDGNADRRYEYVGRMNPDFFEFSTLKSEWH
jgi:hypothetical protein